MSKEIYEWCQLVMRGREAGRTIEVLLDLPGYNWETITDIDFGSGLVIVTVEKSSDGQFEDVACRLEDLKAARLSPVPG